MLQFIKLYFPYMKVLWLLKFPNIIESQPFSVKGGQSEALFPYWKSSITLCRTKTVPSSTYPKQCPCPKTKQG